MREIIAAVLLFGGLALMFAAVVVSQSAGLHDIGTFMTLTVIGGLMCAASVPVSGDVSRADIRELTDRKNRR